MGASPVADGRCSSAEIRAALDRLGTLPPPRTIAPAPGLEVTVAVYWDRLEDLAPVSTR